MPESLREHIDYVTPGITLREVAGVHNSKRGLQKRFSNGALPIMEPLGLPIGLLLGGLLSYCDLAVTPQCIRGAWLNPAPAHSSILCSHHGQPCTTSPKAPPR